MAQTMESRSRDCFKIEQAAEPERSLLVKDNERLYICVILGGKIARALEDVGRLCKVDVAAFGPLEDYNDYDDILDVVANQCAKCVDEVIDIDGDIETLSLSPMLTKFSHVYMLRKCEAISAAALDFSNQIDDAWPLLTKHEARNRDRQGKDKELAFTELLAGFEVKEDNPTRLVHLITSKSGTVIWRYYFDSTIISSIMLPQLKSSNEEKIHQYLSDLNTKRIRVQDSLASMKGAVDRLTAIFVSEMEPMYGIYKKQFGPAASIRDPYVPLDVVQEASGCWAGKTEKHLLISARKGEPLRNIAQHLFVAKQWQVCQQLHRIQNWAEALRIMLDDEKRMYRSM